MVTLIIDVAAGLIGTAFGVALFIGGLFFGMWAEKRKDRPVETEAMTEAEKKKHKEQADAQDAFEQQMRYNADVAYGLESFYTTGGDA